MFIAPRIPDSDLIHGHAAAYLAFEWTATSNETHSSVQCKKSNKSSIHLLNTIATRRWRKDAVKALVFICRAWYLENAKNKTTTTKENAKNINIITKLKQTHTKSECDLCTKNNQRWIYRRHGKIWSFLQTWREKKIWTCGCSCCCCCCSFCCCLFLYHVWTQISSRFLVATLRKMPPRSDYGWTHQQSVAQKTTTTAVAVEVAVEAFVRLNSWANWFSV